MDRIDRTKIQEVPIERKQIPIPDADKHQQEQISTRYSLRRLK